MKRVALEKKFIVAVLLGTAFLAGCGDDDSFTPVAKNRGYDYAFTSIKEFAEYPCNDIREGREAVVGRNKDSYYCQFDYRDSVYIWAGYDDTLTAYGKEFVRADASSSSRGSSSSYDDDDNSSSSRYSSSYSSSSYSSSRYSSSGYYTSSSSRQKVSATPRLTEKGEQFNPTISYGTLTDSRDGKKYRTVTINGQTWMAENLNYADNEYGQAFCYNDEEEFCELYGRLYTRDAAMNSPDCPSGTYCKLGYDPLQGICPEDWHIPTVSEVTLLMNYIGTNEIDWASAKGWKPEFFADSIKDTYGLSFVPGGFHEDKGFRSLDTVAFMWVYLPDDAQRYFLINASTSEIFIHTYSSYVSIPVRCVKGEMKPFSSSSHSSSSARSSSSYSSSSARSSSSYSGPWSSESPSSSFSVSTKEDFFNPSLTYGTMTDPRDGKKYKTIEFNGQTWMAENLNFSDSSIVPLLEGHNTCYHEKESECELMGRMYSRDAAMNSTACRYGSSCSLGAGPIQGICPDGWHVLTYSEAKNLITYVGSSYAYEIKSSYGWGASATGTNEYGLSFVATGTWEAGNYDSRGGYSYTWVYYSGTTSQYYLLIQPGSGISVSSYSSKELYLPVRCISDTPSSSSSVSSSSAKSSSSSVSSSSVKSSSSVSSSSSAKSSSSSIASSSSSNPRDKLFNSKISYGIMTDPRDGKKYRTIDFYGTTWMAENLKFADTAGTYSTLAGERKICYNRDEDECEMFGRLYVREAATNSSMCTSGAVCNLGAGPIQGICPDGWHLPSLSEAQTLVYTIGTSNGNDAKSAYGWNEGYEGNNKHGLSFVGTGYRTGYQSEHSYTFVEKGERTQLWAYKEAKESYRISVEGDGTIGIVSDEERDERYSIRCVKDK